MKGGSPFLSLAAIALSWTAAARGQTPAACVHAVEEGQAHRARGELRAARASFITCAQDACALTVRRDCMRWLDEVNSDLPTVVFSAKDTNGRSLEGVVVFVDDEPTSVPTSWRAVALDPGPHRVRFVRAGSPPVEANVTVAMGERDRPVVGTFQAPPAPPPSRPETRSVSPWVFALGGVSALAFASFGYFGVTGLQEKDQLRGQCAPFCTDDQISDLKTRYTIADVSLAVGVVALAAATYVLFASGSTSRASARLGPWLHGAAF
jgi:hypothetical protein